MLIIRKDQEAVLEASARTRFVKRITQLIRVDCEAEVNDLSDADLEKQVEAGIARAGERGITWESSVYIFVSLIFVIGPHFDQHPQIRPLLDDDQVSPNERVRRLPEQLSEDVWQSATHHARSIPWDAL